ncbi:MAG: DNA translocase FtsK [Candidatus Omnitrophica bacterium]|nr:DNA translocase FtsK [Candidatus Omnitrophota bacterium]
MSPERRNELSGILLLSASLFLFMSLVSYHPDDLPFFTSHAPVKIQNLCGLVGAVVAGFVRSLIGLTGYLVALAGMLWAFGRFNGRPPQRFYIKALSTLLFCLAVSSLLSLIWIQAPEVRVYRGGILGLLVGDSAVHYFGRGGAYVVLTTVGLLGFLLVTELTVWPLMERTGRSLKPLFGAGWSGLTRVSSWTREGVENLAKRAPGTTTVIRTRPAKPTVRPEPAALLRQAQDERPSRRTDSAQGRRVEGHEAPVVKVKKVEAPSGQAFELPSLDLLDKPAAAPREQGKQELQQNAKVLEEALRDFGIEAKVAEVEMGPVITRYEVEPAPGVKVQKITTLADDLALIFKVSSVRVIAPIPGKARVGIEVPNSASSMVGLREILESQEFRESPSKITLAIGKDAAGHPLVADLAQMPHLLIAGTTGSGKTVCMNALITSMLFNAAPDEVRFIMVDPKMVELSVFNGIPHLMLPVLTNPKQVPLALHWVVQEMESRYRLFARLGVRNIEGYHEKESLNQLPVEEIPKSLPYLVVIIDELADLMLVAQAEVEKTIGRLAHLSRAVGIHMVLATQRPSVDVLTGVIKANFPARISFQVASKVDSRTVLDVMGADKLLGKGDLLFLQPGSSKLVRGQGTLVTDSEIERVVSFLKSQGPVEYDTSILEEEAKPQEHSSVKIKDPLYPEAVRVIVETGQASVSLLQRRMRLGYGRAARILDRMEEEGIVGPIRGAKPREVYLKEVPDELIDRRTTEVSA